MFLSVVIISRLASTAVRLVRIKYLQSIAQSTEIYMIYCFFVVKERKESDKVSDEEKKIFKRKLGGRRFSIGYDLYRLLVII